MYIYQEIFGTLSSAGSEHCPYKAGVVGSNPTASTGSEHRSRRWRDGESLVSQRDLPKESLRELRDEPYIVHKVNITLLAENRLSRKTEKPLRRFTRKFRTETFARFSKEG